MFETPEDFERLISDLRVLDGSLTSEAERIDLVAGLERLQAATAAAKARVAAGLSHVRRSREAGEGIRAPKRGLGLAAELGLARRVSPNRAARDLGFALALEEMPHTAQLFARGEISEFKAFLMVRETAALSVEDRQEVDSQLADSLVGLGEAATASRARAAGYRLDPGSALRRGRRAHSDRTVTVRPAPDTMTYLTGFLPVAQGVACYAALKQAADQARARGDDRSRGQVMADTLVERLTGRASADEIDVEVQLVMTDSTLLGEGDDTPARVDGYGSVPASLARHLVKKSHRAWLRRLYLAPDDGALVGMDSRRRCFDGQLRSLIVARDETCRTPWCDAPIRHLDHPVPVAEGGETTSANAAGLCEACNYAKEARGWKAEVDPRPGPHRITITTPTGHTYTSTAPDPPTPPQLTEQVRQRELARRALDDATRLRVDGPRAMSSQSRSA